MTGNNQKSLENFINRTLSGLDSIKKELFIGVALALIVGFSFAAYSMYQDHRESSASKSLFAVIQFLDPELEISLQLEGSNTRESLKNIINKYNGTMASKEAALLLAYYYDETNQPLKALESLEQVNLRGKGVNRELFLYRKMIANEKAGKCEKAIEVSQKILNNKSSIIWPQTLLQKALCLETLGKIEEAKKEYENLSSSYGDTEAGKSAEAYLRLLKSGV